MTAPRKPQQRAEAERRWPIVIGLVVALALYALLPTSFLPGVRIAVVVASVGVLVALIFLNPRASSARRGGPAPSPSPRCCCCSWRTRSRSRS